MALRKARRRRESNFRPSIQTVHRYSRPCRNSSASSSNPNARPSKCSSSIMLYGRRLLRDWWVHGSRRVRRSVILSLLLALVTRPALSAAGDQQGQVTFNSLPVPGATIVATQGEKKIVSTSDLDGRYRLSGL